MGVFAIATMTVSSVPECDTFLSKQEWPSDGKECKPEQKWNCLTGQISAIVIRSARTSSRARHLKGCFIRKCKLCHHLLTLVLFQTCMTIFFLRRCLKNVYTARFQFCMFRLSMSQLITRHTRTNRVWCHWRQSHNDTQTLNKQMC